MSAGMRCYGRLIGAEDGISCEAEGGDFCAYNGTHEYEGVGFFDDEDRDADKGAFVSYVDRYGGAARKISKAVKASQIADAPTAVNRSSSKVTGDKKQNEGNGELSADEKGISDAGTTTKGVSQAGVTTKGIAKDRFFGKGGIAGNGSGIAGGSKNNSGGGNDGGESKDSGTAPNDGDMPDIIKELGLLGSGNSFKSDLQYISIIGSIEGHSVLPQDNKTTKYEHLIPELIAVEENPDIKGLLLILNTVGGDVEAGLALSELVAGISKPTVSLVIGGGHSIGIPLAVSADYSFVAKSATMTLHPIRTSGTVITAEPTFEYLKKTQERVVDFIVEHSHAMKDDIEAKMNCTGNMANDVGTLLFGPDAVDMGLIDSLGSLSQALKKLRQMVSEAES